MTSIKRIHISVTKHYWATRQYISYAHPCELRCVATIASRKSGVEILLAGMSKAKKARPHASWTAVSAILIGLRRNLDCDLLLSFFTGLRFNNSMARFLFWMTSDLSARLLSTSAVNCFLMASGAVGHTLAMMALRNVESPERWIRAFLFGKHFPPSSQSQ